MPTERSASASFLNRKRSAFAARECKQVWDNSLHDLRLRKRTKATKCIQCRIQSLCGMCPANGEMENGDRESPVEFLCHVAHLRAAALGVEIPAHGECEFCAGGEMHDEMMESARRIANKEIDVEGLGGTAAIAADSVQPQFQRAYRLRQLQSLMYGPGVKSE